MKKILILIITIILFPVYAFALDVEVNSKNILLYNIKDKEIIYEKNSNENTKIASLTKIITILVALEHIDNLNEKVTLTEEVFYGLQEADASVAGFQLNEVVTYEDLLYGAMLPSGADATNALAINLFENEANFVKKMNDLMKKLNINNTTFTNTSGLDDDGQKSTLNDYLNIILYAFKNEEFVKIFNTKKYTTSNNRLTFKSTLLNLSERNNLETSFIKGSKTGYTDDAGLCLVSYASNNNLELLLITTNSPVPKPYYPLNIKDAITIYNYYFDNYSYQNILSKNQKISNINTKYSKNKNVNITYNNDDINLLLPNDLNKVNIKYNINNDEYVSFKNKIDKPVSSFELLIDGKSIYKGNLYLLEKVDFSLIEFIKVNIIYIIGTIFIIVIILKKKKHN